MNYDTWIETYKPKTNHVDSNAGFNGWMFETYDAEFDFVKEHAEDKKVWTLRDGDDGELIITAGLGWVNRLGYFVTEIPWENELEIIEMGDED